MRLTKAQGKTMSKALKKLKLLPGDPSPQTVLTFIN